jgi:hypothetical protein
LKEDLADCVEDAVRECKNETVTEFMIKVTYGIFDHLYATENCYKGIFIYIIYGIGFISRISSPEK